MIEKEHAVRLVQALVERNNEEARAAGPPVVETAVSQVTEHPLCWVVAVDSAEYVRTGNYAYRLMGGRLYLVDRVSGGLYEIGGRAFAIEDWEPSYRRLVRGESQGSGGVVRRLFRRGARKGVQWVAPAGGPYSF
ncbi:YrhB domain-containing protein [Streptomyces sp. NBC_00454]|uniref:YrhB domain-containing protein n=1 Tax=Streptomyces sp. NBC_00454 TaxID=2975747 RepID=UPI0030E2FF83